MSRIGLIAGNGKLPLLLAEAARSRGLELVAVAHRGETDPALQDAVASLSWVRVGQVDGILRALKAGGVERAIMAGGLGKVRALAEVRPDLGAWKILARLRSLGDDGLLRAVAGYFEERGVQIVSAVELLPEVLAPEGHLAGPPLSAAQAKDAEQGFQVAQRLGAADVGQMVVVKGGIVLAVEAVEGTDATLRRAGELGRKGGKGGVVVKVCKPGQDERFDLPAVGERTLDVMREAGLEALIIEAGKTVLLDAAAMFAKAERYGITLEARRAR